jgi:hypothetical protein
LAILKQIGIRCIIYSDDILLLHQDRIQLARSMVVTLSLLQLQAGLNVKTTKCAFHPSQRFQCLGYVWDTVQMKVFVPSTRLKEMHRMARRLFRLVSATDNNIPSVLKTRVLTCFVGKVVATFRGIRGARRYLLYLQHALGQAVRKTGWNGLASLSPDAIRTLAWWSSDEPWKRNGYRMTLEQRPIQVSVRSDAATESMGWGGTLQRDGGTPLKTRGNFTPKEQSLQINALELLGCWYTIRSLLPHAVSKAEWARTHFSCELDNTTAIKYARVAVSRSLRMSRIGAKFYDWEEATGFQLSFRHLRGIYNTEADSLSRQAWAELEWKLDPGLFSRLQGIWHCKVTRDLYTLVGIMILKQQGSIAYLIVGIGRKRHTPILRFF